MIESLYNSVLTYDNLLIIGGLIGMGYFLKKLENVPNRRISSIQTAFALHICLFKFPNPIDAICFGLILAGLAQILYTTVLSNITEMMDRKFGKEVSATAPRMITPPIVFACLLPFLFQGCAHYSALPPNASAEEKKAAALADTRAALASKRNQAVAEVLISEAGKYAVSTVKDKIDKEAIKTQLRGRGQAGLDLLEKGEVSPEQMRQLFSLSSLTSKLDAEKFSAQFNSAFDPIHDYIDEVSQTDDPKLVRDWFAILCRGAIKAGS